MNLLNIMNSYKEMLGTKEEFERHQEIREKKLAEEEIDLSNEYRLSSSHIDNCSGCALCEK